MDSPPQTLPRVLGPWMGAAVVVGTVIGSGVFKKAHVVAVNAPEFGLAVAAWGLGGLLTVAGALAYAEVAVRYPRAGGNYVFLREAYGPWAGFLWGWVDFTVIRSASIAVLATMATEALHDIARELTGPAGGRAAEALGFWPRQGLAVAFIAALTAVNARGTRLGGGVQVALTALKVASLVGIVGLPVAVYLSAPGSPTAPGLGNMSPAWPADRAGFDPRKFGVALVGVLWAYQGWMNIGPMAAEVTRPGRNLPLALIGGVFVVTAVYIGANVAYFTVLSAPEMAGLSGTPVATEFCARLVGPVGTLFASLALMTSALGALNGNVLAGPRLLYAMAEDRLAPAALTAVHPTYRTPVPALLVFCGWSCGLVLGLGALTAYRLPVAAIGGWSVDPNLPDGKVPFDVLTDFVMFAAVVFETMAVAAIFRFRRMAGAAAPPYRCPGYPLVPAAYVLVMAAVAANMLASPEQRGEAVIGLGFIGAGAAVYAVVTARRRGPR